MKSLNKEIIMYLIFGLFTTLVNIISYAFFVNVVNFDYYLSNVIAWALSVLFAYITNRLYVFESFGNKLKEVIFFYGSRLLTLVIDSALMFLLISVLKIDDLVSKIIVNLIVIVLNFLLSKLIVFKKEFYI